MAKTPPPRTWITRITPRATGVAAAAALLAAACSSQAAPPGPAARSLACQQQYLAWKNGPGGAAMGTFRTDVTGVQAAASARDTPHLIASLQRAAAAAVAVAAYPMPRCADPARYWPRYLARVQAADHTARSGAGLKALLAAAQPLSRLTALQDQIATELKHAASRVIRPGRVTHYGSSRHSGGGGSSGHSGGGSSGHSGGGGGSS